MNHQQTRILRRRVQNRNFEISLRISQIHLFSESSENRKEFDSQSLYNDIISIPKIPVLIYCIYSFTDLVFPTRDLSARDLSAQLKARQ